MKKLQFTLLFFQLLFVAHAQLPNINTAIRTKIKFNENWRFSLTDNAEYKNKDFYDTDWRQLDLPHDWSIEGKFDNSTGGTNGYFPTGIGWYRKSFTLPDSVKNKKIVIEFDGVYMNSEVWINGQFLGRYPYGYSTFQYDLTNFIKTGQNETNTLAVRVDHSLQPSTRWYNGSGIYRNVFLITTNYIHFHNYKGIYVTTPQVSTEKARIKVEYDIAVHFYSNEDLEVWKKNIWNPKVVIKKCLVRTSVIDLSGKVVSKIENQYEWKNFNDSYKISLELEVTRPSLWSADSPKMYVLKSEIISDGKVLDDQMTPFGIRKIEFLPKKGFFVNGNPEKLKGVCLHHDAGSFGAAVPVGVWHYRLQKLKKMGCNAIRMSHCPFDPAFYTLCDTMGFYLMDEAFDEWTRGWEYNVTENPTGKAWYGYHLYFNQWHETDLRAMILRDRNHPSVVMYSIGNEIPNQLSFDGGVLALKLVNICHSEDPTRPVTSACDKFIAAGQNGFLDALDISGFNYPDRDHGDKVYQPEFEKRPAKLCLGTETYHATHNFIAYRDHDYAIGEFVWVGYDYLGESQKYPRRGWDAGILDIAGNERPEYYLRKSYWSQEPTVRIAIQTKEKPENEWYPKMAFSKWNWPANDTLPVCIYTNCDEIELILNNRSLGKKKVDHNLYYVVWNLKYVPGTIKAIGYKNGVKTVHELKTAGEPNLVNAKINKVKLKPNVEDLAMIEISILDKNGILVPDATSQVSVEVSGAGKLVGLDNGDLFYAGLFKTSIRQAYQGKLLATISSLKNAGDIKVIIQSGKFKPVTILLESK